ncbi:ABC-F family ATP-binding cassette domain-containing protein [Candidatus Poribacteria bacterium]|nr:ABC-F family ATP-binding cassette domain-containing protein [Candidatus Poribacteria bacterium]
MTLTELENISKSFGATEVLKNISWQLQDGDKVGLVGNNGSGKSTLLKIIARQSTPDTGTVRVAKESVVSYLRQDPAFEPNVTVRQIFDQFSVALIQLKQQMEILESLMSEETDEANLAEIMAEYGRVQEEFQRRGGYTYETRKNTVLNELGLSQIDFDLPAVSLSGGQKARVELACLLLCQHGDKETDGSSETHVLLLDEPDNHLDMTAIEWLERFLRDYRGAFVLVSHNRFLLDQLVTEIVELDAGKITIYHGNYSDYIEQKKRRLTSQYYAYVNQQQEIERLQKSITLLKKWSSKDSKKRARQAKSMERQMERMNLVEKPNFQRKRMQLDFEVQKRSGEIVVEATDLTKRYGDNTLFAKANFNIRWGEHVALVGPNAMGKTTLIKIILGLEPPTNGEVKLGEGLIVSYFDQEMGGLTGEHTIFDELQAETELTVCDTRYLLVKLFSHRDNAFKKIKDLSGGERNRVILSKLVYSRANFLVLDEPTNHLDIASVEVLENALAEFPGTILLASHDRYLLTRVAHRIIELNNGEIRFYPGGYEYYSSSRINVVNNL